MRWRARWLFFVAMFTIGIAGLVASGALGIIEYPDVDRTSWAGILGGLSLCAVLFGHGGMEQEKRAGGEERRRQRTVFAHVKGVRRRAGGKWERWGGQWVPVEDWSTPTERPEEYGRGETPEREDWDEPSG